MDRPTKTWWCALAAVACAVAACSGANVPSSTVTGETSTRDEFPRLYVIFHRDIERVEKSPLYFYGSYCFLIFVVVGGFSVFGLLQTCCGPDWRAWSSRGADSGPIRNRCRKNGASAKAPSSSRACAACEWVCRSWTWQRRRVSKRYSAVYTFPRRHRNIIITVHRRHYLYRPRRSYSIYYYFYYFF